MHVRWVSPGWFALVDSNLVAVYLSLQNRQEKVSVNSSACARGKKLKIDFH